MHVHSRASVSISSKKVFRIVPSFRELPEALDLDRGTLKSGKLRRHTKSRILSGWPSKKVLDFCGRRVIDRNFLSVEVHFYRETGITRQLSKSQALKVYSLKTPGIEGSGNGARNFLIEGEWRGSRGPKFLPRAARQPAALPDHIPGPGTACLCAPSPLGALGGPACPHPRPSIFTRRLKFEVYQKSSTI